MSELEEVRSELRRLGYLSHGLERYLLQDLVRGRAPGAALLLLAGKVGLLAGGLLALALAVGLAVLNGSLASSPADLPALFAHLLLPSALAGAAGFAGLSGVLVVALRRDPRRGIETLSLVAAVTAVGLALALLLWRGRPLVAAALPWQLALLVVALPLASWALVRVLQAGLLALAVRLTDRAPRRALPRRWLAAGMAVVALLLGVVLPLVAGRGSASARPPALPSAPGERVALVGLDGVLPQELEYLIAHGDLAAWAALAAGGGVVAPYRREESVTAAFWTTVATGRPSPEHGVAAVDSFRPRGVRSPLDRSGPLRAWWQLERRLGLAEYRPILADRRRAFTVWELAARGGAPVVAVNWWVTYPAAPLPGLVVAHGAYQLLSGDTAGAVAPESARPEIAALRRAVDGGGFATAVEAALQAPESAAVLDRALLPDRFYRAVIERALPGRPRAAAVYLPGLDIAADGWAGGDVAFADVVRRQLVETDQLLGRLAEVADTLAVVVDPGRRGGDEGRVLLWRRRGCAAAARRGATAFEPAAVASALLRALGLPQSEELPAPPAGCDWPSPPARVATYGLRQTSGTVADNQEYLRNLRSLGYLR